MAERDLAVLILNRWEKRKRLPEEVLKVFRSYDLNPTQRAFVFHLVYGTIRWLKRLDWVIQWASDRSIKRIRPVLKNIIRVALYQILFMERVPDSAAVNEAVNQTKRWGYGFAGPFVNGLLRRVCRERGDILYPDPESDIIRYLTVYYSFPSWLIKYYLDQFGLEQTISVLSSQNQVSPLCIRVNSLKIERDHLLKELRSKGIDAKAGIISPQAIWINGIRSAIEDLSFYKKGLYSVQSEASQLVSLLLSPQSGSLVMDICAGHGGKSIHMAEIMKDRGRIVTIDIDLHSILDLKSEAERCAINSIECVVSDAQRDLCIKRDIHFDYILIDAPCSGSGIIGRHPDIKWNRERDDLQRLTRIQKEILENACHFLKPKGLMLYVTCSILREENEEIAFEFLKRQKDFSLVDIYQRGGDMFKRFRTEEGFFRTYPHVHGLDGFFGALITKDR